MNPNTEGLPSALIERVIRAHQRAAQEGRVVEKENGDTITFASQKRAEFYISLHGGHIYHEQDLRED